MKENMVDFQLLLSKFIPIKISLFNMKISLCHEYCSSKVAFDGSLILVLAHPYFGCGGPMVRAGNAES